MWFPNDFLVDDDVIGTLTVPTLKMSNPCISEDLLRPDILSDRDALHTHFCQLSFHIRVLFFAALLPSPASAFDAHSQLQYELKFCRQFENCAVLQQYMRVNVYVK